LHAVCSAARDAGTRHAVLNATPEGKLLGTINLPIYSGEPKKQICATNEAFGGADGKTLFIAGCDAVYTIPLKTAGIVPANNVNK